MAPVVDRSSDAAGLSRPARVAPLSASEAGTACRSGAGAVSPSWTVYVNRYVLGSTAPAYTATGPPPPLSPPDVATSSGNEGRAPSGTTSEPGTLNDRLMCTVPFSPTGPDAFVDRPDTLLAGLE